MFEINFSFQETSYQAQVKLLRLDHHIEYQLMLLNGFGSQICKIGIAVEDFRKNNNNWYLVSGEGGHEFAKAAGSGIHRISCSI